MTKTTTTSTQHTAHSTLNIKPNKIILIMMLMAFSFLMNHAKAQTTADSALTVTDTSITTPNNIVVTDSSGNTTLFAGGQQSGYSGMVGIGTNTPTDKLEVKDTTNAKISVNNGLSYIKMGIINQAEQTNMTGNKMIHQPPSPAAANSAARAITTTTGETIEYHEPQEGDGVLNVERGGGNNNQTSPNPAQVWGCNGPDLYYSAYRHIFDITPCADIIPGGMNWGRTSLQMLTLDHDGVTINTSDYSLGPTNGFNVYGNTTLHGTTINNGNLTVNGNISFTGTMDNMNVLKCSNTDYAATITNCGGEGKGLLVKAGGGVNAATDYAIFEVEDYAGNPILRVDGKNNYVYARDIHVTQNNFPDYVFNADYHLMPLSQLENYINTKHHLPEMPTAKEVKDNSLSIGEATALLTKKIEELTLYLIELKKENENIKTELKKTKK